MSISNTYYQINTLDTFPVNPTGTDDEDFGVLVLELGKADITKRPIFILFTIDATGSMRDYASSHTTKIQFAIQTLKNIIKYLSTLEIDAYVQINTFNEDVHVLIPPTGVSTQSIDNMITQLETVDATGATNIEIALKAATTSISDYAGVNPTHSRVHIFMTDGDPTSGATTSAELLTCTSNDYLSINIGFGPDHNAKLLCELSNRTNSEYHFIDNIEHASMVYGESLHKVLYPCLYNVRVHIENGFIYDWQNNKWADHIYENTLIGEMKKYYHIKSSTPNDITAHITGYHEYQTENQEYYVTHIEEDVYRLPDLLDLSGNTVHDTDIIMFAFRQCVLEVLHKATHLSSSTGFNEKIELKDHVRDLFRKVRSYAVECQSLTNGIIKQLLNDLYIAYWNIGDTCGEIYIYGRHSSQGNQYAHTPGNIRIPEYTHDNIFDIPPMPVLRRNNRRPGFNAPRGRWTGPYVSRLELDIDDADSYNGQTDNEYSCYSTPGIRRTTTSIQQYE
jgi:Mg-chelatase subunit ChlD